MSTNRLIISDFQEQMGNHIRALGMWFNQNN